MTDREIETQLAELQSKLDEILVLLRARTRRGHTPGGDREPAKPAPLSAADEESLQAKFSELYQRWLDGGELQVQRELEDLDVVRLRQLAEANFLNVTSRTSKSRTLNLIAARFREKRQIHREPVGSRG